MPVCDRCGITQATIEMRRSPKKENGDQIWFCKNKEACKQRRGALRANRIAKGERL